METEETFEFKKEHIEFAEEVLTKILSLMGLASPIEIKKRDDVVILSVEGSSSPSRLIGKDGHTLDSLQFIMNRIMYKKFGRRINISIDVGGYRERRNRHLQEQAEQAARQAKQTGEPVVLPPMNALERRIVHMALADDTEVDTESINHDRITDLKCVQISPVQ